MNLPSWMEWSRPYAVLTILLIMSSDAIGTQDPITPLIPKDAQVLVEIDNLTDWIEEIRYSRLLLESEINDALKFASNERNNDLSPDVISELQGLASFVTELKVSQCYFAIESVEPLKWLLMVNLDSDRELGELIGELISRIESHFPEDKRGFEQTEGESFTKTDYRGYEIFTIFGAVDVARKDNWLIASSNLPPVIDTLIDQRNEDGLLGTRKYKLTQNRLSNQQLDRSITLQIEPEVLQTTGLVDSFMFDTIGLDQVLRIGFSVSFGTDVSEEQLPAFSVCATISIAQPASGLIASVQDSVPVEQFPSYPNGSYLVYMYGVPSQFWEEWTGLIEQLDENSPTFSWLQLYSPVMQSVLKETIEINEVMGPVFGKVFFQNETYQRNGVMTVSQSNDREKEKNLQTKRLEALSGKNRVGGLSFEHKNEMWGGESLLNTSEFLPEAARFSYLWFDDWLVMSNPTWLEQVADETRQNESALDPALHSDVQRIQGMLAHKSPPSLIVHCKPLYWEPYINAHLLREARANFLADKKHDAELGNPEVVRQELSKLIKKLNENDIETLFQDVTQLKSKRQARLLMKLFFLKTLARTFGDVTLIASVENYGIKISLANRPIEKKDRDEED